MTSTLHSKLCAALLFGTLGVLAMPNQADAFCGFYVSNDDGPLYNSATQVVLMRGGTRTVLSMRNTYSGPAKDFAMVIPVPVVLQEADVKTLDDAIFDRLNNFTQPRLVEYYEKNPCANRGRRLMEKGMPQMSMAAEDSAAEEEKLVMVEAEFEVGEYEIVILSAKESTALESWLVDNAYNIPEGASEILQSYISQGMYFFVAKVNADKVTFNEAGDTMLSPLRFAYDSEDFSLPVRLGLLNAQGEQDLIVHTISREGRFRVSNGKNITIPTNLIVDESVLDRFTDFYEALFARVHDESSAAIVTEYAWGGPGVTGQSWTPPTKCDPCLEPISQPWSKELMSLGADQFEAPAVKEGSGTLTASASTLAIESKVILQPEEPPLSPDEPSQPPTELTYDLNEVQALISEQNAAVGSCYEQLNQSYGKQPEILDVIFSIAPDGTIARITSTEQSQDWTQRIDFLVNCTGLKSLVLPAPEAGASVEALIRFQFDVSYVDNAWLDINSWTVTRMHARYTAEQLENDLYFTSAPPIEGGRGTPQGKDPSMRTTAVAANVNNFQARYMVLHPYTKWHMCLNPEPGNWTGSGAQGARSTMEVLAAPQDEEKAPLNLMQLVKSKRGWLKKDKEK